MISNVEHLFICVAHLHVFCGGKNVCSGPLPIFKLDCLEFLVLSCISSLHILDINPLLNIQFMTISSIHQNAFHFVDGFFYYEKALYFHVVP